MKRKRRGKRPEKKKEIKQSKKNSRRGENQAKSVMRNKGEQANQCKARKREEKKSHAEGSSRSILESRRMGKVPERRR